MVFLLSIAFAFLLTSHVWQAKASDPWSTLYSACPETCADSDTKGWGAYSGLDSFTSCNQTILLDLGLYNEDLTKLYACSGLRGIPPQASIERVKDNSFSDEKVSLKVRSSGSSLSESANKVTNALKQLQRALSISENNASQVLFAYSGGSVVGLFAGPEIQHSQAATVVVQKLIERVDSQPIAAQTTFQYCSQASSRSFGVFVDTTGNLTAVQQAIRDWNSAKCLKDSDFTSDFPQLPLRMKKTPKGVVQNPSNSTKSDHVKREECKVTVVSSGDTCTSVATKCGISLEEFKKYNPSEGLCSPLKVGLHVCCSAGTLPDYSPKPNADGTCASYLVKLGDDCSTLSTSNGISEQDIENWNKNTWGWTGCGNLPAKTQICLSSGNPPLPFTLNNAVCGPQVNGTEMPKNGSLASLNPCPLNACCDTFGQCGITDEFCTISNSTTGAPGTAAPHENGCISNCGTEITNNDDSPKEFMSIGYFEAFDQDRECLNMDVTSFDTSAHTHLHFAFATITSDYTVDTSKIKDQFEKLLSMDSGSIRRVLSFGGWSFSTDVDSFPIFRKGVSDANRETFASNAAKFITDNNLDGIDFDWEYPAAPDIPGIPAGDSGDGDRYLEFLKLVRDKLPSDKTLSIAAPASYWYLKGFPIGEISDVVDYIVYMTYDLHGQWDFGHKYPQPGCDGGNCLWSHVNLTETTSALSMITKAGVPATKVIVGLASYGRSFKETDAGCTGTECHYIGPDSAAAPGRCTKTAGYIANAELQEIIDTNDSVNKLFDEDSDSNILVYNETQWVAYMDDDTKKSRTSHYQDLKMGGVVNWAVDLESFSSDGGGISGGNGTIGGQQVFYIDPSVWDEENPSMNCDAPCYLILPPWQLPEPSVVTPPAVTTTLDVAWPTVIHSTDSNGKVTVETTTTRILEETTIARTTVTISDIPLANVNITVPFADGENLTFIPVPQIPYQVVTITDDPNPLKETGVSHPAVTRSVTLPPWPQITNLYLPEDSDEDSQDPGSDDDYDGVFPKLPKVTVGQGSGGPGPCKTGCGVMCQGRFCDGAGHGGADGDNWPDPSFPDPGDINPPPDPNDGPGEDGDDPDDDDNKTSTTSCSKSTVTDMYVSCATQGPSSTSCTTTSSVVEVGCDITAFTTTTGVLACSIDSDAYLEQGEDGRGAPTAYITGDSGKKTPCWSGSCGGKPSPTAPPSKTATTTTTTDVTTTTTSSTKTTSEKSTSTGPSETSLSNTSPDEDSYTCKGSSECSIFSSIKGFCNSAKARLNGDRLYGTLDSDSDTGACYTDGRNAGRGCGVFIKGDGCQIKGSVMQAAFDHLHDSDVGGCEKCGAVTFSNGCVMKVDYVTGCGTSNGPAQPITISDNTTSSSPTQSLSELFSYNSANDWAVIGKGPDRGRSRTGTTSKATLSPTSS